MAGSVRSCCVPQCNKTRADNVVLHTFPDPEKDTERFAAWVKAAGINLSSLENDFIYKNRRICHDHFEEKYLTWTRRLSHDAVPTLCLPGQVGRVVMKDITNIGNSSSDLHPMAASTSAGTSTAMMPEQPPLMQLDVVNPPLKLKQKGTPYMDDKKALVEMLKRVIKKKDHYAIRLKKALKLSENVSFQNVMKKFTSLAAIFMAMQFREIPKKKMGRRFTEQEKIMALSIYKQGPRCYRLLNKIFVLPSPLTLSRLISRADIRAGINQKLFNVMQNKISTMKPDDKLCILLFDEVALTPNFEYNQRKDHITGFVTNGEENKNKIADHALVFMIRGVTRNYKQPVAYTFCSGSTRKEEISILIKTVIRKLHAIGLRVLATVCDQGASNVSGINYLVSETRADYIKQKKELKRNIFEIDNKEVIPIYDPPHLLKGVRNNLLDKNLKCTIDGNTKIAKWDHVIKLHEENPSYSGIRLLKNLTEDHIKPDKCKMKVKMATQVFSQRVASTMGYLAAKHILPAECQETADVLLFFDSLFDSMNGSHENSKRRSGKPLLRALSPNSMHNNIWSKSKKVLESMKFLKNGKEITVPSVSNWLHTINNAEYLRDVLFKEYNIKSIWMRHFKQDPLENFFGSIRSHGCRNVSPSPAGFEIAFSSLLISNLTGTHSPGSNCEQDSCTTMFKSMKELFKISKNNNPSSEINLSYMQKNIICDFELKREDSRILAQLEYVTGYLLRKTKSHVFKNCTSCKAIFYNTNKDNEYLRAREYNKHQQYLEYPKNDLIKMFSEIQDVLMWVLKNQSNVKNIKIFAKTILYSEICTNFITCNEHKNANVEYIYDLASRFFIYNWCKDVNNILKGRRKEILADDVIQNLANVYAKKHRKLK